MLGKKPKHPPVCNPSNVSNTICMKWLFLRAKGQDKATESFISIPDTSYIPASIKLIYIYI